MPVENVEASAAGGTTGRAVVLVMEQLQQAHGFRVLNDLLIARAGLEGPVSAQVAHVVIDPGGALVIDTETRDGASILGTSSDATWAAVYPGGRTESFSNPLLRNAQHLDLLNELLRDQGVFLTAERVNGLVVMVGADITDLQLDSENATRITTIEQLPSVYAARRDYTAGEPLDPEEQIALAAAIAGLNRASATHAAQDQRTLGGTVAPAGPAYSVNARGEVVLAPVPPARAQNHPARALIIGAIALAVVLTAVWGFQIVASLRSQPLTVSPPAEQPAEQPAAEEPTAQPLPREEQLPTVELAQAAFKKADPQLFKQLSDPESPDVGNRDGYAAYTWEYVSRSTNSAIRVRTVTVLLNENGRVVRIVRD